MTATSVINGRHVEFSEYLNQWIYSDTQEKVNLVKPSKVIFFKFNVDPEIINEFLLDKEFQDIRSIGDLIKLTYLQGVKDE